MAELARIRRELSNTLCQGKLPDFYLDKASKLNIALEDKCVIFSVHKLHERLIDKGNTPEEALKSIQEAIIALNQHVIMLFFQVKEACPNGRPDSTLITKLETDIEAIRNNDPVFQKPPPELIPLLNEILQSVGFRERVTGEWVFQTASDPEARRRQFDNVDALAVDLELLRHEIPLVLEGQHPVYPRCSITPSSSRPASGAGVGPALSSVPHSTFSFKPVPSTTTSAPLPVKPITVAPVIQIPNPQPAKKLYAPRKLVPPKLSDSPPVPTNNKCAICGDVVAEFWWCKECASNANDPRGKKLLCADCRDRRHQPGNKERENHTFTRVAAPAPEHEPEPDTPPAQSPPVQAWTSAGPPSLKGFPKPHEHPSQPRNNLDADDDEEYHSANEGDDKEQVPEVHVEGPASRTRNRTTLASARRQLLGRGDAAGPFGSIQSLGMPDGVAQPAIVLDDDEMVANRSILTLVRTCAAEHPAFSVPEVRHALNKCGKNPEKALAYLKTDYKKQIEQLVKKNDIKSSFDDARDAFVSSKWKADKALLLLREKRTQAIELVECLLPSGGRQRVTSLLNETQGDVEAALARLNETTAKRAIKSLDECKGALNRQRKASASSSALKDTQQRLGRLDGSVPNPVLTYPPYEDFLRNKKIPQDRRARSIYVEAFNFVKCWGAAENVIKLLDMSVSPNSKARDVQGEAANNRWSLEDILLAIESSKTMKLSLKYLQCECVVCGDCFPRHTLFALSHCQCNLCMECAREHFRTSIEEKGVTGVTCPSCNLLNPSNVDALCEAFAMYTHSFKNLFTEADFNLFSKKLVDYNIMTKEPNYRWCAWCKDPPNGFIWQDVQQKRMRCNVCRKYTCFECKLQWEEQHEGLSCEDFARWKQENDPKFQERGLSEYLEQNGIDCPKCKYRYMLARGGCIHFICKMCKFQFCAGCNQAFVTNCPKPNCKIGGLHAHHPRSCFYHLRDHSAQELEKLLQVSRLIPTIYQ